MDYYHYLSEWQLVIRAEEESIPSDWELYDDCYGCYGCYDEDYDADYDSPSWRRRTDLPAWWEDEEEEYEQAYADYLNWPKIVVPRINEDAFSEEPPRTYYEFAYLGNTTLWVEDDDETSLIQWLNTLDDDQEDFVRRLSVGARALPLIDDLLYYLMNFLDLPSLVNFSSVNRQARYILREDLRYQRRLCGDNFSFAAQAGCLQLLHQLGNRYSDTAFEAACLAGHLRVAKWLRSMEPRYHMYGIHFEQICARQDWPMAGWLLEHSNYNAGDALYWACAGNQLSVVEWLAERTYLRFNSASLAICCKSGFLSLVQWHTQTFSQIDHSHKQKKYFRLACRYGHLEIAQHLITFLPYHRPLPSSYEYRYARLNGHSQILTWLNQLRKTPILPIKFNYMVH